MESACELLNSNLNMKKPDALLYISLVAQQVKDLPAVQETWV